MVENEVQQTNATVVTHRFKTLNPLGLLTIAFQPNTLPRAKPQFEQKQKCHDQV